jgi:hypothetical protein
MTDLERAAEQIELAHGYGLRLFEGIDPADWFRMPPAGVSHVGWQVGHLTYAAYRLALLRLRGRLASDSELFPDEYAQLFGLGSSPEPDASRYPPPAAIRAAFDRVCNRVRNDVPRYDSTRLNEPLDPPHSIAKTKLECLFWCAAHAMVHAGQIGLLRRQLGHHPLW